MLESFLSRATLILISSALAVLGVGCSENKQTTPTHGDQQQVSIGNLARSPMIEAATAPKKSPEPQSAPQYQIPPNSFELALDKAAGALTISQSAQSPDDWYLVVSQFQDAIALMKNVRRQSPNFTVAQIKISEYQQQIQYAIQQANPIAPPPTEVKSKRIVVTVPQIPAKPNRTPPLSSPLVTKQPVPLPISSPSALLTQNKDVFIIPIKRRIGGTPIIEVTFNGEQKFEMIVDTGASGTVITQKMAKDLGVVPVGKAKANTASSKAVEFPIGYVNSMAVTGVMVNQVAVAIAGSDLETGLLGHDFFGNYDVTIRRNVVEFRPQSNAEVNSLQTEPIAPTLPKNKNFAGYP
ncbi:MAG: TIGR02281 family clan AA aspartic protease [Gloeotrichia echinulata GP01]